MKRKKGIILITVFAIALSLTALAGAFSIMVFSKIRAYTYYINSVRAYYLARAGIEYMELVAYHQSWMGNNEIQNDSRTISFTELNDSVNVTNAVSSDVIEVKSTAVLNGVSKTIVCELDARKDIRDGYRAGLNGYYFEKQLKNIKWK